MGRKRFRIESSFQPVKCAKRYLGCDDRISQLPDDILVDILSLLSLREAARTSVLSTRWTNLWKHTTCLNLDGERGLDKIHKQDKIRDKVIVIEGRKYVRWVNRVLRSHKALALKEFIIRFALDRRDRKSITKWLEFAFSRQVQRLELDLYNYSDASKFYRFPVEKLLDRSSGPLRHPRNFKSLRALRFRSVKLTDGAIEFFLRNCPLLERLSVNRSTKMLNVEVCGSSLMLKHLKIVYCFGLKSLKISAPNLTSLRVSALEGLVLENVPKLVEIYANCVGDDIYFRELFSALACSVSQLEVLRLELREQMRTREPFELPQLPKLKKLVINYAGRHNKNLIRTTALIRASPHLEEFVVKCERYKLWMEDGGVGGTINSPHEHLKVVKFSGYYGSANDVELVRYILKNCIVLEKLLIDPSGSFDPGPDDIVDPLDVERTARKTAKQHFEGQVPQDVELVIL